jgi:hypothetical protein
VFTEPERLAVAGLLAGYTGLTREAPWTCASTPAGASRTTCHCFKTPMSPGWTATSSPRCWWLPAWAGPLRMR